MNGTRVRPVGGAALRHWNFDESNVRVVIRNRLSKNILNQMRGQIGENVFAPDIWLWLQRRYGGARSNKARTTIEDRIKNIKLSNYGSVEEYVQVKEELFSEYINAGGELDETQMKNHFLDGINGELGPSADMLDMLGDGITYDEAITKLKSAELSTSRSHRRQGEASVEVNAARIEMFPDRTCHVCADNNHIARSCSLRVGSGRWCLKCQDSKHFTTNCRAFQKLAIELGVKHITSKEAAHVNWNSDDTEDSDLSKLFFVEAKEVPTQIDEIESPDDHPLIQYM